jgi:hypothetical protein
MAAIVLSIAALVRAIRRRTGQRGYPPRPSLGPLKTDTSPRSVTRDGAERAGDRHPNNRLTRLQDATGLATRSSLRKSTRLPDWQLAKINESPFDSAKWIDRSEQLLLSREPQPHSRDDHRERITRARQAAEALFTPRRQVAEPSVSDSLPSADQPVRKPRVLGISSPAPLRLEEVKAPVAPEPQRAPEIPRSKFARSAAW